MAKSKAHPDQLGFGFAAPSISDVPAALAGIEQRICRTVGTILASVKEPREVIAAKMSVLLGEEVSRAMLDAYSSPARSEHKVPMSRFLALVAVTHRHDLMDPLMREIGSGILIGEEVVTARLGDIEVQLAELADEKRRLKAIAPRIRGKQG